MTKFPWQLSIFKKQHTSFWTSTLVKETLRGLIATNCIFFKVLWKKLKTSHIKEMTICLVRTRDHSNPQMKRSLHLWLHSSVGQRVAPVSRSLRFKPRWSTEFFKPLCAIIAFTTVCIISSLDFISAAQTKMWFILYIISPNASLSLCNSNIRCLFSKNFWR